MTRFEKYKINSRETLNQKVYKIIKDLIIKNELKANEKLNEVVVAESLGVSATPVRETFRLLAAEGLVEIIPYKGVFVKEYTLEEIKDVYECRTALENLAIELSINKLEKEELYEMLYRLEKVNINDHESIYDLSNDIHNLLLRTSNNKMLEKLYDQINHILLRDRNISAHDINRKKEIVKEHKLIIESLIDNDLDSSKKYMTNHISSGYDYIIKKLENK